MKVHELIDELCRHHNMFDTVVLHAVDYEERNIKVTSIGGECRLDIDTIIQQAYNDGKEDAFNEGYAEGQHDPIDKAG